MGHGARGRSDFAQFVVPARVLLFRRRAAVCNALDASLALMARARRWSKWCSTRRREAAARATTGCLLSLPAAEGSARQTPREGGGPEGVPCGHVARWLASLRAYVALLCLTTTAT